MKEPRILFFIRTIRGWLRAAGAEYCTLGHHVCLLQAFPPAVREERTRCFICTACNSARGNANYHNNPNHREYMKEYQKTEKYRKYQRSYQRAHYQAKRASEASS